METRKQEIQVHKDALRAQSRLLSEEIHERTKDLGDRLERIDKLKHKYGVIMMQINPEGEEERSQAYYIIKAAQQKEELQKERDALQREIDKTEDDNRKLDASLAVFNAGNQRLHYTKTRGGMTADDLEKTDNLSIKFKLIQEEGQQKLQELKMLEVEVQDLENQGASIEGQCQTSLKVLDALRQKSHVLSVEGAKHLQQIQRAR
jgi:coiled-coil domain-containing protein 39